MVGMRGRIFISYRRGDARGDARSIRDRLARKFGESNVFMDVDSLLAGQRFDHQLDHALAQCDVLIAVIGPRWMEGLAEKTRDEERDYVRAEIAAALKRQIVVIPVLTGQEGQMPALPRASELPEDIRDLVLYQKHSVTHESFGRNIDDLITAINTVQQARRKPFPWKPLAAAGGVAAIALVAALVVFRAEIGGWIGRSADVPAPVAQPKQAPPETRKADLSPAEIAERYSSSTVLIRFVARLYERESGRALYHRVYAETVEGKTTRLPVYVRVADKVLPWLTTDDENQKNYPVRVAGGGTGFVASPQGFILTTSTVGASWRDGIRLADYVDVDRALLISKVNGKIEPRVIPVSELRLPRWDPVAEGATVFAPRMAGTDVENFDLPAGTPSAVVGRNEVLVARFGKSSIDVNAELVRSSLDQNVALLKVAAPDLTPTSLASGEELKIGTRVVALSFASGSTVPSVAEGIVRSDAVDGSDRLHSHIQTSIQVGYGTSGSPVFDPEGKVIGMISFFIRDGAQLATYLVPIRHGRTLLQPQR
jgi:S1-C subfamily serine protease